MNGLFITFEGTEGSGKTTQIGLLAETLRALGKTVRLVREPGGTPIGEEIRHTLKYSPHNQAMTAEAEFLLLNAARAQLVREVIRPALTAGEIVIGDRFYDSTTVYQGYGRGVELSFIRTLTTFAVGDTRPQLTLLLMVPVAVSECRRETRSSQTSPPRDRMEEAGRAFFERVEQGYQAIALAEPSRIKIVDATQSVEQVRANIWRMVQPLL